MNTGRKIQSKIQEDTATESNWPKCIRDFIHRCNRAILRGESMNLTEMSTSQTLVKELTYECYELDGTYVNKSGQFYHSQFNYISDLHPCEVILISDNRRKYTAFEKPFSLN